MAKIAFGKPSESPSAPPSHGTTQSVVVDAQVVTEPVSGESVVAVTTYQGTPAAVPERRPPARFTDGEDEAMDASDVKYPSLNIVQGVGQLCEDFDPGAIVLDKQILVVGPPPKNRAEGIQAPVVLVVVGFRPTRWTEVIPGGGLGRLFDTEEEVYQSGGTTNYNEKDKKPYFRKLATALVLVQMPSEGDPASYPFVIEGKHYAVAQWNMQGAAYTAAAAPIKTWKRGYLKDQVTGKSAYANRFITLNTVYKKFQTGNGAWVPSVKIGDWTSPEFREAVADFTK